MQHKALHHVVCTAAIASFTAVVLAPINGAAAPARAAETETPVNAVPGQHLGHTAQDPPSVTTPSWWNGVCDDGYNSNFGEAASWDGLVACGYGAPSYSGGGIYRHESSDPGSPLGDAEWECPELSNRWLYQEWGIPDQMGNGYQVVSLVWNFIQSHPQSQYPLTLVTPSSATAGSLGPGDVVSYANVNGDDGHTDVVTAVSLDASGNGTINTLNENLGGFINGIRVTNWNFGLYDFNHNFMPATGWLHLLSAVHQASAFETAFNASGGAGLWSAGTGPGAPGPIDYKLGIMPGTSPSITKLPAGGFEMAFNASGGGGLWTMGYGPGSVGAIDWNLGMDPKSSPSITALPAGGFEVAINSGAAGLWTTGAGPGAVGPIEYNLGVTPGTSPSITALPAGGFEMAFNASGGSGLWTIGHGAGSVGAIDWKLGMDPKSSPSIAAFPAGGFEVAINTGSAGLWSTGTGAGAVGPIDYKLGVTPGTSPSITTLPAGGFEMAFNASDGGGLWTMGHGPGSVGAIDWKLGMAPNSSPSIAATGQGGFEMAFNASGGSGLWTTGNGPGSIGAIDWKLGVTRGTSPGIAWI